jgi:hypothetical protein
MLKDWTASNNENFMVWISALLIYIYSVVIVRFKFA